MMSNEIIERELKRRMQSSETLPKGKKEPAQTPILDNSISLSDKIKELHNELVNVISIIDDIANSVDTPENIIKALMSLVPAITFVIEGINKIDEGKADELIEKSSVTKLPAGVSAEEAIRNVNKIPYKPSINVEKIS